MTSISNNIHIILKHLIEKIKITHIIMRSLLNTRLSLIRESDGYVISGGSAPLQITGSNLSFGGTSAEASNDIFDYCYKNEKHIYDFKGNLFKYTTLTSLKKGLFITSENIVIKNISIEIDDAVTADALQNFEGYLLANGSKGVVENCSLIIKSEGFFSGLIGDDFDGVVRNCYMYTNFECEAKRDGGWITGQRTRGLVENCYAVGNINTNSGGICGSGAGYQGTCTIQFCYCLGKIIGQYSGGICGANSGYDGKCVVRNCYYTGAIEGADTGDSGGICGSYAGTSGGQCIVEHCYTSGDINGLYSGGICGSHAGAGGSCLVRYCYTLGKIMGGGICGGYAGDSGSCLISYCYSIGTIQGDGGGGICSFVAGGSGGFCTIECCYTSGTIQGEGAGGIVGAFTGQKTDDTETGACVVQNCYSTGVIGGIGSGGIVGSGTVACIVRNSYTTGNMTGRGSGGIVGSETEGCLVDTCYSKGDVNGVGSGGISGSDSTSIIIRFCYSTGQVGVDNGGIIGRRSKGVLEYCRAVNGDIVASVPNSILMAYCSGIFTRTPGIRLPSYLSGDLDNYNSESGVPSGTDQYDENRNLRRFAEPIWNGGELRCFLGPEWFSEGNIRWLSYFKNTNHFKENLIQTLDYRPNKKLYYLTPFQESPWIRDDDYGYKSLASIDYDLCRYLCQNIIDIRVVYGAVRYPKYMYCLISFGNQKFLSELVQKNDGFFSAVFEFAKVEQFSVQIFESRVPSLVCNNIPKFLSNRANIDITDRLVSSPPPQDGKYNGSLYTSIVFTNS